MMNERCPKCDAATVVAGRMTRDQFATSRFTPAGMRFFTFRSWWHAPSCGDCRACLTCGLAWTHLRPKELRQFIEKYGDAEAKLDLSPFRKAPPDRDLI